MNDLRFINNVRQMAKRRHLEMSQLEQDIGVEAGYFAALQRGEAAEPGTDLLLATADRLSVPVDVLLKLELEIDSEDERLLCQYLNKLTQETMANRLTWLEDPFGYLYQPLLREDGTPIHPLHTLCRSEDEEEEAEPCYHSCFRPGIGLVPVAVYGCVMEEDHTLYLVRVWNTGDEPLSPGDWDELELQMIITKPKEKVFGKPTPFETVPLCHSDHERPSLLNTMLETLFSAVEDSAALPKLTNGAREIIESYLAEGEPASGNSDAEGSCHGTGSSE